MSLYSQLQLARSEEDVKDAYIKALGLKGYTKGLIDIQTNEIWFEAKDTGKHSSYAMFTQLLHYVQVALNKGETVPPFLAVIDTEKAALMKSADVLPFLIKKDRQVGQVRQPVHARGAGRNFCPHRHALCLVQDFHPRRRISGHRQSGHPVRRHHPHANHAGQPEAGVRQMGGDGRARNSMACPKKITRCCFLRTSCTTAPCPPTPTCPPSCCTKMARPCSAWAAKTFELGNKEGYRQFWAIYHKPPKSEYRDYLLERRDSLIPLDERSFKGAYYTPLHVVDKAYDKLTETLGKNWQKDYIVWDMCCGVGNLEVKHSNPRNIYMSTLDQADVDVMRATKTCVAAQRFQYDYLNDDITDDGKIDYSLTNKVPGRFAGCDCGGQEDSGADQSAVWGNRRGHWQRRQEQKGSGANPHECFHDRSGLCEQGAICSILGTHCQGATNRHAGHVQQAEICQCAQFREISPRLERGISGWLHRT